MNRRRLCAALVRVTLAVAGVAVVLAACTAGSSDTPEADPAANEDAAAECAPQLDEAFQAWAEAGFSGSIAISTGGEPDCLAAYGLADQDTETPNTVDTVFSIGSISKAFTAAAVLDLVDAGKVSLDDRAGEIVPDLGGPAAEATVEQLLLHTTGLTGSHGVDHEPLGRDEAVAAIGGLEQTFEPGSDYLYSNAGYTLLALIVEEASGRSYRDYLTSEILPLPGGEVAGGFWDGEPVASGPRAVGYLDGGSPTDQMGDFEGPHWALNGNGDLAMTAQQLAAWAHALFTGQVVAPAAVEAITSLGFDHGDGTTEAPGWVSFDASMLGEPFMAAAGGGGDIGHDAVVAWLPESGRVVALAANTPGVPAEDLLQAVGPALVAGDPLPTPDVPDGHIDPADLEAHAGTYELETGGTFDARVRGGGLEISADGADAIDALFPPPGDLPAGDVTAHEESVLSLLAGETGEGRNERRALEADLGPIDDVRLAGTVVDQGELRTYVTITVDGEPILLWYALDEEGGIAAVEAAAEPPTLPFLPVGEGEYRPDDPTGDGPDVTVQFEDGRMTVSGPTGPVRARLVP